MSARFRANITFVLVFSVSRSVPCYCLMSVVVFRVSASFCVSGSVSISVNIGVRDSVSVRRYSCVSSVSLGLRLSAC